MCRAQQNNEGYGKFKPGFHNNKSTTTSISITVVRTLATQAYHVGMRGVDNFLIFCSVPPRQSKTRWWTFDYAHAYANRSEFSLDITRRTSTKNVAPRMFVLILVLQASSVRLCLCLCLCLYLCLCYFFLGVFDFVNYLTRQFLQHAWCRSLHCDSVLRTH